MCAAFQACSWIAEPDHTSAVLEVRIHCTLRATVVFHCKSAALKHNAHI